MWKAASLHASFYSQVLFLKGTSCVTQERALLWRKSGEKQRNRTKWKRYNRMLVSNGLIKSVYICEKSINVLGCAHGLKPLSWRKPGGKVVAYKPVCSPLQHCCVNGFQIHSILCLKKHNTNKRGRMWFIFQTCSNNSVLTNSTDVHKGREENTIYFNVLVGYA